MRTIAAAFTELLAEVLCLYARACVVAWAVVIARREIEHMIGGRVLFHCERFATVYQPLTMLLALFPRRCAVLTNVLWWQIGCFLLTKLVYLDGVQTKLRRNNSINVCERCSSLPPFEYAGRWKKNHPPLGTFSIASSQQSYNNCLRKQCAVHGIVIDQIRSTRIRHPPIETWHEAIVCLYRWLKRILLFLYMRMRSRSARCYYHCYPRSWLRCPNPTVRVFYSQRSFPSSHPTYTKDINIHCITGSDVIEQSKRKGEQNCYQQHIAWWTAWKRRRLKIRKPALRTRSGVSWL